MPTIHEKFIETFRGMGGQALSTSKIKDMILKKFPGTNANGLLPNDHASGNENPCWCARTDERVFDKIAWGQYRVRRNLP